MPRSLAGFLPLVHRHRAHTIIAKGAVNGAQRLLHPTSSSACPSGLRILPLARPYSSRHQEHTVPVGGLSLPETTRASLPPRVKQLVEGFPSVVTYPIHWGEQDVFQHLNNVHYMRYFESGRIAYFDQILKANLDPVQAQAYLSPIMTPPHIGPIVKSCALTYRAPVTYPDTVTVATRVPLESLKPDRFTQSCIIVSHRLNKVCAEGEAVIVSFDFKNNTKTTLPEQVVEVIKKVETEWSAPDTPAFEG